MLSDADSRLRRARVSLDGLSLGDAFGERFFAPPDVMIPWLTTRTLPPGPWTWTDDTAMAISLIETLAAHGRRPETQLRPCFLSRRIS